MKFITALPATLIHHQTDKGIHYFGTTDMNGILEVSDNDKYIAFLKAKFSPIEDENTLAFETIGAEIKSNTTPISGDTDKKEGKPNVNNGSASNGKGVSSKRTSTAKSNKNDNGKKRGGRSPNNSRPRNAGTHPSTDSKTGC